MSLLGVPFWTWSAHLCRSAGMGRTGCAPACARNRRVRRTNSVSVCGCGAQCHARNDALDIGDLRAAESERIQGAGGSLIGGALCASHAREEKRQANYANTAAPRTVTGLLVAGDLFADRGLAHLSLCIEGTGAHMVLAPIGRSWWRRIRQGSSGKYFLPPSRNRRATAVSRASAARPGSPPERSDGVEVPQDRAAFGDTLKGVGMTAGAITMTNRTGAITMTGRTRAGSGGWGNPCYPTDAWIRRRRGSLEWCGAS